MKKIVLISLVFAILIIAVLSVFQVQSQRKAAEEMYENFCTALSAYPALPASFLSGFCQFEKDGIKYLTVQNKGENITGVRFANGETMYCHNGITYRASDDGLIKAESDMVDVNGMIGSGLASFLADVTVLYTYHRPSGSELPLWIYPDDPPYLRIKREAYGEYMETMLYSGTEPREVRWCITKSASEEDTKLFLHASEHSITASALYVHGWGDVPEDVLKLFAAVE